MLRGQIDAMPGYMAAVRATTSTFHDKRNNRDHVSTFGVTGARILTRDATFIFDDSGELIEVTPEGAKEAAPGYRGQLMLKGTSDPNLELLAIDDGKSLTIKSTGGRQPVEGDNPVLLLAIEPQLSGASVADVPHPPWKRDHTSMKLDDTSSKTHGKEKVHSSETAGGGGTGARPEDRKHAATPPLPGAAPTSTTVKHATSRRPATRIRIPARPRCRHRVSVTGPVAGGLPA